ncbi:MAG: hypothetical protein ACYCYO_00425 [Bacilli bacterium]
MALSDLDLILNKDAILATYPSDSLKTIPDSVFETYRTYARTHIALGDTERYVNTIFKWVGGDNKGAFIGAVVGDYGHGKTSFQVHVWAESIEKKILAVPPFAWKNMSDVLEGTAAWVNYTLEKTHPELAGKANRLYEKYREMSVERLSKDLAKETGRGYEIVEEIVSRLHSQVSTLDLGTTPENLLDYLNKLSALVQNAGFVGVLVLLDEPEVAAKTLGNAKVSQILFDLVEGLRQRQGNYGVFISMPENFLATVQQSFSSLTARLQERGCMPRLRDMYGRDFAKVLWSKYSEVFALNDVSQRIVTEYTLQAIGQVASSERRDLSYGPRTVISAFRRMVRHFNETRTPYTPEEFVLDCINSNILINLDYSTKIREAINAASSAGIDERSIITMSAYPNGISADQCRGLGIEQEFLEMARRARIVAKRGTIYFIESLSQMANGSSDRDELEYAITDIFNEYAPSVDTFAVARDAFVNHFLPLVFEKKQNPQSLVGWEIPPLLGWRELPGRVKFCEVEGAFRFNVNRFPKRRAIFVTAPLETQIASNFTALSDDLDIPDTYINFRLHWNTESHLPTKLIEITPGEVGDSLGVISLALDLIGTTVSHARLETIVDPEYLTPLGVLYLIGEMDKKTLTHEYAKGWETIRSMLLREMHAKLFSEPRLYSQSTEETGDTTLPSNPGDFISGLHNWLLSNRYPKYQTLIKQPRWTEKVDAYARILRDDAVPLTFKRGHQEWQADKDEIAHIFGIKRMNLEDFFKGYEDLIEVRVGKRDELATVVFKVHPLEEQIKERIMEERPHGKMKIDGKECWWIQLHDILPLLKASGYRSDEIARVVDIGRSRKSFDTDVRNGKQVLYCVPRDPDQLRTQLTDKFNDLLSQIAMLMKVPGFNIHSSFDESAMIAQIQEVQDDNGYDSVLSEIHREFEKNNARIPHYRETQREQIEGLKGKIQDLYAEFSSSQRQVASLERAIKGQFWGADFDRYIRTNLTKSVKKTQTSCSELLRSVDSLLGKVTKSVSGLSGQIQILQDSALENDQISIEFKRIIEDAKTLHSHLNEYDNWLRLLVESDALYDSLLKLSTDKVHETPAKAFLDDLDEIWEQIREHIATRNVLGLTDHRQFKMQLDELDQKRKIYQTQLRDEFERSKSIINIRLQNCSVGSERVNEAFNPEDVLGGYTRIYDLAVAKVHQAIDTEWNDLQSQRLELLYARDVIGRIEPSACSGILDSMSTCEHLLGETRNKVTIDLIQNSFASNMDDDNIEILSEIATIMDESRNTIRESKMLLRKTPQHVVTVQPESASLLDFVSNGGVTDLKHIILKLIEGGKNTDEVLDGALDALVVLFKAEKIRIIVELPRR